MGAHAGLAAGVRAIEALMRSYDLAMLHVPDDYGRCPVCGDAECWVGIEHAMYG